MENKNEEHVKMEKTKQKRSSHTEQP